MKFKGLTVAFVTMAALGTSFASAQATVASGHAVDVQVAPKPNCAKNHVCFWTKTKFNGTKTSEEADSECTTLTETARSAQNALKEGTLYLFSDTKCKNLRETLDEGQSDDDTGTVNSWRTDISLPNPGLTR
ncbi:peptidase inhibitor family I36 protein [Actinosynnema sp. NPDC050436]|uniref:peptidase inhibitor family I36 protein n=1 Tax=Actinosynnema sp. NPDC050436 TaxID=3155659 RepID=UPI0033FA1311